MASMALENRQADAIRNTPSMIEAGVVAFENWAAAASSAPLTTLVYNAMERERLLASQTTDNGPSDRVAASSLPNG